MAKRDKVEFVCSECGGTTVKWQGQCPHCRAWNTLQEFKVPTGAAGRYGTDKRSGRGFVDTTGALQDLADVTAEEAPRVITGLSEFDRVMGAALSGAAFPLSAATPASANPHCFFR